MNTSKDKHKITEIAIKQNLLLWQMTKSLLDIDKKLKKSYNSNA